MNGVNFEELELRVMSEVSNETQRLLADPKIEKKIRSFLPNNAELIRVVETEPGIIGSKTGRKLRRMCVTFAVNGRTFNFNVSQHSGNIKQ